MDHTAPLLQGVSARPAADASRPRKKPRTSPSWVYPFKGIYYFARHRFLWSLLRGRLIPCLLLSAFVFTILFVFTYLPQVAFLAIFYQLHALAFVNAVFVVLAEGAAITALLFEAFLVDETQVDVFDSVLINEGLLHLVYPAREILSEEPTPLRKLGKPLSKAQYAPFSFRQICEFVVFLPINLIPFVGTPIFLILTGYRGGPLLHTRYFHLLGLKRRQRRRYVRSKKWSYTWFGTAALMLQLVPVLSMFFLLTTAAGAALWAADLNKREEEAQTQATGPAGRNDG